MLTRGFSTSLALLRIAVGISLLTSGTLKMSWFGSTAHLDQVLANWAQHPANAVVAHYLSFITRHHALFSRLVVLGELGLGVLLIIGFLTPLAAILAFLMVANFHFAGSSMFSMAYVRGQSGLAYLLIFPVLFFGRAGTALGLDGVVARTSRRSAA
jgi:uncharacterized membrane protein YphA (DoxX/SURF4 family)